MFNGGYDFFQKLLGKNRQGFSTQEIHKVTSNDQSGGITAHTVNFGKPVRHINDQIASDLLKKLDLMGKNEIEITAVFIVDPKN